MKLNRYWPNPHSKPINSVEMCEYTKEQCKALRAECRRQREQIKRLREAISQVLLSSEDGGDFEDVDFNELRAVLRDTEST